MYIHYIIFLNQSKLHSRYNNNPIPNMGGDSMILSSRSYNNMKLSINHINQYSLTMCIFY